MDGTRNRRDFLRLAAGAAAVAATGAACGSGSDKPAKPNAAKAKAGAGQGDRTLRIAQWSHYVPAYDAWFDNEYTRRWSEEHDVEVLVDHIPFQHLRSRVESEVTAGRGHDVFALIIPPAGLEDEAIDHGEIIEEIEAKTGPMTPFVERSVRNQRTGRYFGVPDFWVPNSVHYRTDLWEAEPSTWAGALRAAATLKAGGHPFGLGFSPEQDSAMGHLALLFAHGGSIQDEEGAVTINRPATIEAVRMGAAIFSAGPGDEVLGWDAASDNRFLASGKASLILDALSALRTVEQQDPALADQIALAPALAGPAARTGPPALVNVYLILKSSPHQDTAKQFLVDLVLSSREGFLRSGFYNLPSFSGAVPDMNDLLAADPARPAGKYGLLATAAAWSTNLGHPGHDNAAVEEVYNQYLIPKMFAAAARGEMTAEESVRAAEAEINLIYDKWRERGKL